jgi:hypothetical protein
VVVHVVSPAGPESQRGQAHRPGKPHFVNSGAWDFQIRDYISDASPDGHSDGFSPPTTDVTPDPPFGLSWNPLKLRGYDADLLQYCGYLPLGDLVFWPSVVRPVPCR